jgi:hypothetical protein
MMIGKVGLADAARDSEGDDDRQVGFADAASDSEGDDDRPSSSQVPSEATGGR